MRHLPSSPVRSGLVSLAIAWFLLAFCIPASAQTKGDPAQPESSNSVQDKTDADVESELPWDYAPYRVLIWIVSRDPKFGAQTLREPVSKYLDRDFNALWRTSIEDAPAPVATAAFRSMDTLTFDRISASDPVIAVKRDHDNAVRIQSVRSLFEFVEEVPVTRGLQEDVMRRAEEYGDATLGGAAAA